MRPTIHDGQLVLLGADTALLAELDWERAERLALTRQLREERRLAQRGRGTPCRCPRPAGDVAEHRCLWCGRVVER
jgi:hypothetical protein